MPRENRQLIFDYDEVYQAMNVLCVKNGGDKLPAGNLMNVKVFEHDKQQIIFTIVNHKDDTSIQAEFSLDFLAAALMLYCRENHIPLPKDAKKLVHVSEHSVVLRVLI